MKTTDIETALQSVTYSVENVGDGCTFFTNSWIRLDEVGLEQALGQKVRCTAARWVNTTERATPRTHEAYTGRELRQRWELGA